MSVPATRSTAVRPVRLQQLPRVAVESRAWLVALAGICAVASLYHWLQSRGHVTPAVFTDELLFSELARSFAAGSGFVVRDQPLFFPAFVPAVLQAPAWLADSTPVAYSLAKALNTVLMCSAAVPAYWLARQLVRPLYALIVAAATVAGGGMIYHGYLTSEAAAYPVFLVAVAACVWALATPSRVRDLVAIALLALAVATRAQFVVLPLAFALTLVLVGRPLRRHVVAITALGVAAALGAVAGASSLGFYEGARMLDYPLAETLRWTGWTASLLPFAAGMLVAPGALLGLAFAVRRPRRRAERNFAVMTSFLLLLMPLQAGLIAAGEAHKPFERYVFYLVPLIFLAFFAFAERTPGGRTLYTGVALVFGGIALAVPFASLALSPFAFDSPTISAVETLARWTSQGDAAALVAAAGVLATLVAVALQRRPLVLAVVAVGLAFAVGVAAYSGDRRMTRRTLASLAPVRPDWLERTRIADADVLVLPGGSLHAGWVLESWNRNVGRTLHLGDVPTDPLPSTQVGISRNGIVATVDGKAIRSRYVVVNDAGTRVELVGRLLSRPAPGLALYRTPGTLRLRTYAEGLDRDGWARSVLEYAAWPAAATRGVYRIGLALPEGRRARAVTAEAGEVRRQAVLRPGRSITLELPAAGSPLPPLAIRIDRADLVDAQSTRPRLVAARVKSLEFAPEKGSRN